MAELPSLGEPVGGIRIALDHGATSGGDVVGSCHRAMFVDQNDLVGICGELSGGGGAAGSCGVLWWVCFVRGGPRIDYQTRDVPSEYPIVS